MIPYGRQTIDDDDMVAVARVLASDWLTTGPVVEKFERAVADFCGSTHAVAVSSGTAALHAAMAALGIGPGDEVIVPAITFVATANSAVYQGATPVFADVDPETGLVSPESVAARITTKTRAVVGVDYAGQPCDYACLRSVTGDGKIALLADACHALGAFSGDKPVGSLADISTFSFHPVKPITTGEGGMAVTSDTNFAEKMRVFRNHGITTDFRERESRGTFSYEMVSLGFNYRLPDFSCALGLSQLQKLPSWIRRRQEIAGIYDRAFSESETVFPLQRRADATHGFHLYIVRLAFDRDAAYRMLRRKGIGVNVHYMPVYLHAYYRERFGTGRGLCPNAEGFWNSILSLPIFPSMSDDQVYAVVDAVRQTASELS